MQAPLQYSERSAACSAARSVRLAKGYAMLLQQRHGLVLQQYAADLVTGAATDMQLHGVLRGPRSTACPLTHQQS
jgi:hypothetical protein